MAINIDDMAREIQRTLEGYTSDITQRTYVAVEQVGEETKNELGQISPTGNRKKKKYKKSWKVKKNKKDHVIVHNTEYRLTHLLEKGHAKRGGGRTRAFPHIIKAEQKAIRNLIAEIERAVRES